MSFPNVCPLNYDMLLSTPLRSHPIMFIKTVAFQNGLICPVKPIYGDDRFFLLKNGAKIDIARGVRGGAV